ncbi:hypothetical protein RIF29_16493 [Crotalaria pallida]|uniref:Uncharacterized protein n=1 Tax=Crotalaria pallida TaxID=3830 RepID=A0AAN9IDM6_CROPI
METLAETWKTIFFDQKARSNKKVKPDEGEAAQEVEMVYQQGQVSGTMPSMENQKPSYCEVVIQGEVMVQKASVAVVEQAAIGNILVEGKNQNGISMEANPKISGEKNLNDPVPKMEGRKYKGWACKAQIFSTPEKSSSTRTSC